MHRMIRCVLLALLAVFLLAGGSLAAEYDGYIIRLKPQVTLFSEAQELPEQVEEVYEPQNLYTTDDEALIAELEAAGLLEYAEPNYRIELFDMPDDPACLDGTQWNLDMLGMEEVWARNLTGGARTESGRAVRVGVVDTGLYAEHEDLQGLTVIPGVNTTVAEDSELRYDTTDEIYHGTFVTGVIAATAGNGLGIAGIAPEVELVPLKCYSSSGGNVASLAGAIYAGVDTYQCQVLNMSLGVLKDTTEKTLKGAVEYASEKGVILIAAVGNTRGGSSSTGNDPLNYPAAYDAVIGVGAVDSEKEIARFSYQNESVFVTAPGASIYGLDIEETDDYRTDSGTSFAAPAVTAAAALLLSVDPELTPQEFKDLLQNTAEDLGADGYDTVYGHGLMSIKRLVKSLQSGSCMLQEGQALVSGSGLLPNSNVWVLQVTYNADGAQTAYRLFALTATETGTFEGTVELLAAEEGGRASLMLTDSGWWPLMPRWEKPAEEGGPDDGEEPGTDPEGGTGEHPGDGEDPNGGTEPTDPEDPPEEEPLPDETILAE